MVVDELLESLLKACARPIISVHEMKQAMENVLVWLTNHNTDENCRKVDLFVVLQIEDKYRDRLPENISAILFDMGGALHDTHTAPKVAENFESTPRQLLERVRKLPY